MRMRAFASKSESLALIHTGLQPGEQDRENRQNRFNGFSVWMFTVNPSCTA
jgi:hypothetical protein